MYKQAEKSRQDNSRAVAHAVGQKNDHGTQGPGFVDNRRQSDSLKHSSTPGIIQREKIAGVEVYLDKGYPCWKSKSFTWHLTMKDPKRWHITKSDRSDSYWFEMDGGFQGGVNPKKSEYGKHKKKHHNLEDAPDGQYDFIKNNIMAIIKVK